MELELKDIMFGYGKTNVIEHMNLVLTPGVYGLLGPNGAGKSTLISLIVGNQIPQGGEILWNGKEITKEGIEYRKIIGYKPQQQTIYPEFYVTEFLDYMATLKGLGKCEKKKQIDELLPKLNLTESRNKKLKALSGGMLQRVLLAQALLGEPQIVILDEPTAGLDPMERINMRRLIQETAKNKIVLLATHIIEDIGTIAKEILFMKKGKIVLRGDIMKMREYYENGKKEGRMQGVEMQDEIMILENIYDDMFGELIYKKQGIV